MLQHLILSSCVTILQWATTTGGKSPLSIMCYHPHCQSQVLRLSECSPTDLPGILPSYSSRVFGSTGHGAGCPPPIQDSPMGIAMGGVSAANLHWLEEAGMLHQLPGLMRLGDALEMEEEGRPSEGWEDFSPVGRNTHKDYDPSRMWKWK